MPNTLDLAGVIGTWVAVFLALVALLALLPAYILYKRSRSQIVKALFKVDDPSQNFVYNAFLFGFLLRQTVRVPDLRNPPDLRIFENVKLENRPTADILGPRKSTTGWVEFAQIITAVFPGVKYGSSDVLDFADEQTSLPVHNTWLLALGLLHRFSLREDCGLPVGAAVETSEDTPRGGRLFSGLSGYLNIQRPQGTGHSFATISDLIETAKPTRITFQMHGPFSLQTSLKQDSLSFHALAMLFAGYIDGGNGQLFTGLVSRRYDSQNRGEINSLKIAKVAETELVGGGLNILPGIHVQATKKIGLVLTGVQASDSRLSSWSDDSESNDGLREAIERQLLSLGLYNLATWHTDDVWILGKDACRFACAYLKQKPSPQGFLYETSSDIFVSEILWGRDIAPLLALAKTWLPKANITGEAYNPIIEAIRNASDVIPTKASSSECKTWSRCVMQAISSLDDAIDMMASQQIAVTPQDKSIEWAAIRAIYASNQKFRDILLKQLADQDQPASTSVLRAEETAISLLGADDEHITHSFDFDFRHVFTEAELDQRSFINKEVPIIDTVLASLQGQLRAVAWKMALSPKYLGQLKCDDSDISLVESYVRQLPGPEVWLDSTAHQSNSSPPVFREQYVQIDAALASTSHEYANRRNVHVLSEDMNRSRTELGSHLTSTSSGSSGSAVGSPVSSGSCPEQTGPSRDLPPSQPSVARSRDDFPSFSGDLGRNQITTATMEQPLTNPAFDILEGFELSRIRPIARAKSSASRASAPF